MGLTMPRDSGKLAMHQPKKMEERRDGIVGGGRPPVISFPFSVGMGLLRACTVVKRLQRSAQPKLHAVAASGSAPWVGKRVSTAGSVSAPAAPYIEI